MNVSRKIRLLYRINRNSVRFLLLFILYFSLGQAVLYIARPHVKPYLVDKLHAEMCSAIINHFSPSERTTVEGDVIGSSEFKLSIAVGCEGMEGIILVISAVCAFSAGLKKKAAGIVAGSLILYVANLARIIILYYSLKYRPGLFDFLHMFVGQTFIVLIGVLFFITWLSWCFGENFEARPEKND